jgi:hypothetical protein
MAGTAGTTGTTIWTTGFPENNQSRHFTLQRVK